MVFIDSNVPMYLVGAAHPNKVDAQRRLEALVTQRVRLVTDAEVLTEILHPPRIVSDPGFVAAILASFLPASSTC